MEPEQPLPRAITYLQDLLTRFGRATPVVPEQPREITYDGDSVRIILRESRLAKLNQALFGTGRLCLWAVAALAFLSLLLSTLGLLPERFRAIELSKGETGMAIILSAFFAGLVLVSTLALVSVIRTWLRTLFGSDTIVIATTGWHVTRKVWPFRKTHTFDPAAGWTVTAGPQNVVGARCGRKLIVMSGFGKPGERIWIRDEIRMRFLLAAPSGALPEGYSSRAAEDGSVIVTRNGGRKLMKESWCIAPNYFGRRRDTFGVTRTLRITDATVRLNCFWDHSSTPIFRLQVHEKGGRTIIIEKSPNHIGDTLALGELLARETGWPLEVDPQARE